MGLKSLIQWITFVSITLNIRKRNRRINCVYFLAFKRYCFIPTQIFVRPYASLFYLKKGKIAFLRIIYKKTEEWYIEWQRVTTNDNKWQRVVQRMTTSESEWYNEWQRMTTSHKEWYNEWQRITTSDNEW